MRRFVTIAAVILLCALLSAATYINGVETIDTLNGGSASFTGTVQADNIDGTSGDILVNYATMTANNTRDVVLFGDGTNAQAGNFESRLFIFGGGAQTRFLSLYQEYNGHSHISANYGRVYIEAMGAGGTVRFSTSAASEAIILNNDGSVTMSGALQAADYYSGDGTQGMTGTCADGTDLTVKDGIITGCS